MIDGSPLSRKQSREAPDSTGSERSSGNQAKRSSAHVETDGDEIIAQEDLAPGTVAAIPAYNEALTIGSVVHQARQHVDMVVVLDDGSSDDTARIARQAGARVLRHVENQGKAQAIRTLFDWAVEREVDHVVLLDGDGQHDPRQIPQMLKPVRCGEADVALGFRFGENTEMPFYRRIGKRVLDYATAIGTAGEVTDSQCGFRAFNREAMEKLELREDGFAVESEMVVSASENGLSMAEVPITCRYDEVANASTEDPVTHGVGVLDRTIRLVTERRPLMFMGVPAFLTVLTGIGLGTWVVWTLKMTGQFAIGTALLTSILVLAGTFLGLTAVLLHVIPNTMAKHMGKQAQFQVEDSGPFFAEPSPTNGATTTNGGDAGKATQANANGHANGEEEQAVEVEDPAEAEGGSRLPQPRPPEDIPDWTEPTDQEIPSEVDP